jgi:predicted DNA-binding transcriptional regulator YafY
MAVNKAALIRYKTIDQCLRNRTKKWTLDLLIEKVSAAVQEHSGNADGVSKRTVQLDLQHMRSEHLYNAPIEVVERKYYRYSDPEFSITQAKLSPSEIKTMQEVVGILRQLNGFNQLGELSETILKLDHAANQEVGNSILQYETNSMLKGLNWLEVLYKATATKKAISIYYRSFKARDGHESVYFPYLLKEYRNRWFLMAARKNQPSHLINLALDRIEQVRVLEFEPYVASNSIDLNTYYADCVGVTKTENAKPVQVLLQIFEPHRPYLLTKPIHASQTLISSEGNSSMIEMNVVLNFELEREILGYGAGIKVHAPRILVKRIKEALLSASSLYTSE